MLFIIQISGNVICQQERLLKQQNLLASVVAAQRAEEFSKAALLM